MPFPTNPMTGSTGGPGEPPPPPPNDCPDPPCCPDMTDPCCSSATDPECCPGDGSGDGGMDGQCCDDMSGGGGGMEGQCCMDDPGSSSEPVGYGTGQIVMTVVDLPSRGYGLPWGHVRSYSNRLEVNGTATSVDYGNGYNWMLRQTAYLLNPNGDESEIRVVISPRHAFSFTLVGGNYVGAFGALQTLVHDATNHVFRLIQTDGSVWEFHDFDQTTNPPGLLAGIVTPGDRSLTVLYPDAVSPASEVRRSFTDPEGVTTVESFLYEYVAEPDENAGHIESVTLRRDVDDSGWYLVRRAVFSYYRSDSVSGDVGDLESSVHQLPEDTDAWVDIGTYYYRYYRDSAGGVGFAHGLKFALEPEAFRRLSAGVGDPLLATDAQVAQYADYHFEYDDQQRVSRETVAAGTRTYGFEYTASGNAIGYNSWQQKTVETLPDGNQTIVYTNHINQVMLKELKSGSDSWIEYRQYDETLGSRILYANPSAVQGYDDTAPDLGGPSTIVKSSEGLVEWTEYYTSTTATPTTSGGAAGYRRYDKISEGLTGGPIKLLERTYFQRNSTDDDPSAAPVTIYPVAAVTRYQSEVDGGSDPSTTEYAYTWHVGTVQVLQRTTTLPVIPTEQNGSGVADARRERFDEHGNLIWEQGPRNFVDHFFYEVTLGVRTQMLEDVEPPPEFGWPDPPDMPRLDLQTDYEYDDLGRRTQQLGPRHAVDEADVRTATWNVYKDVEQQVWTGRGYVTGTGRSLRATLVNPVSIDRQDRERRSLGAIQAVRASTEGRLSPSDCFPQSSWVRWTANTINNAGQKTAARVYHTIPACGLGEPGTNYDEATFGYDALGRRNRTTTPGGTITRITFDPRSLVTGIYVGTDDANATAADPTGDGAPGNNMVRITGREYDDGAAGGDGNLTELTQYVDADPANNRVTENEYDFRDRLIAVDGEEFFYEQRTYDNLDQVVQVDRRVGSAGGGLISLNATFFDPQGRVYQTEQYGADAVSGDLTNPIVGLNWYDESGNLIKQVAPGAKDLRAFTKSTYDGYGRKTADYLGLYTGSLPEPYDDVGRITNDNRIFEQAETTYDAAGNTLLMTAYRRFPGSAAFNKLTTSDARRTRRAAWYDGIGRVVATADYGTASAARPASPPESSDAAPVGRLNYDAADNPFESIDPLGRITRRAYNDAGRIVLTVSNYVTTPSVATDDACGSSTACRRLPDEDWASCLRPGDGENVAVRQAYNADGKVIAVTVCNPSTGDQMTRYLYGVTPDDSDLASNDLLREVLYPDTGDALDRVTRSYDRQESQRSLSDQNGTKHEFDYDKLGRRTADRVTALGTGVDGAVRRLETSYDARGRIEKQTSYSAAAGGAVVNQIQYEYEAFGLTAREYQSHAGPVNTGTSPHVDYTYAPGIANTIRITSVSYPNGRAITSDYGSDGSDDDLLSRVLQIKDGAATLAAYEYLGADDIVRGDYQEPQIRWDLSPSGNSFSGLDSLDRVVGCLWRKYAPTIGDPVNVGYTYDRVGDRTSREVLGVAGNDELYRRDGLSRLTDLDRGDLSPQKNRIADPSFAEQWRLDASGNWSRYESDDFTTSSNSLDQMRVQSRANEITAFEARVGTVWAQPAYDRSGNMTEFPKPADPGDAFDAVYDAWHRLVTLSDGPTFEYDAIKRRTTRTAGGATRHSYYTNGWQLIEERLNSATTAERQFVWGLRYIDDLILRDRSPTDDGTLSERLYSLNDANWNVVAVTDDEGTVQERYRYSGYGMPTFLAASFTPRSPDESDFAWEILYAGYRYDSAEMIYYIRNRYYDPQIGVWLARDPLGIDVKGALNSSLGGRMATARYMFLRPPYGPISAPLDLDLTAVDTSTELLNLYRYVMSNPADNTDFSGLALTMAERLACPAFALQQDPAYDNTPNGCTGVPDNPAGSGLANPGFRPCCDAHDVDWGTCGMPEATANAAFLACMMRLCAASTNPRTCRWWAQRYANNVLTHFYNMAQNDACLCICPEPRFPPGMAVA